MARHLHALCFGDRLCSRLVENNLKKIKNIVLYVGVTAFALVCCTDTAVAQGNPIAASPLNLNFVAGQGVIPPQPQIVTYSSTSSTNVPFSVSFSSLSNWLGVSPVSGTATQQPQSLQVFAQNYSNLANGSYPGVVTITPITGNPVTINATLTIGSGSGTGSGTFSASVNPIVFNTTAGAMPNPVSLFLSTTGSATNVTVSVSGTAASSVQVSPTVLQVGPGASGSLTVGASAASLQPGSYSALINITPSGASSAALSIPVTINVGAGTGIGGGIAANPNPLIFNIASGSTVSATQTLSITTTSNTFESVTLTPSVTSGGNWLSVSPSTISINQSFPGGVTVTVNPASLTPGTTYSGNIALQTADFGTLNVPITVNVGTSGGSSTLTATPNPISISIPSGSTTQVNQSLSVTGTPSGATVSAQATGLSWLSINPGFAQLNGGAIPFTVTANPIGQSTGSYTGSIILTPSAGTPLTIPVNITIGTAPSLSVTPPSLAFAYQTGTATPAAQTIALSSSGNALSFGVTSSTQSGGGWLVVTPQTGATAATGGSPTNLTVQVNPTGLMPGSYQGTITITGSGASNGPQTIPVSLLVTTQPILQLSTNGVIFNYQFGSTTLPSQQQVQVGSSGNALNFNVSTAPGSGGNFVTVTPTIGTTPQTLNLSINPTILATLAPGMYNSTVTLTSQGAGNGTVNIPISLIVGSSTLLNVSQTSLNYNYQVGQSVPASQTFNVSSTGSPLSYTVSAATSPSCANSFLTANPASGSTASSSTVAVSVNVQGLVPGTCTGTVTITSPGAGNSPLVVPVTVQVSNTPLLNVSPSAITVITQVGNTPPSQTVALTSTDPASALNFNVTSISSGWLLVGPTSGTTPNNLTIGYQTNGLTVGTYTGSITVTPTAAGSSPTVIPVTLVITNNATALATPSSLTFTQPFNGPQPATQTILVTSTNPGLSFSASAITLSGGGWLSVTSSSAATPATLTVTANGSSLGQGSYSGVITIVIPGAANNPLNVPVTLIIGPSQSLAVTPTVLNFTYQSGSGTAPASQNVQVISSAGTLPFTVTTASPTGALVSATPVIGSTPGTVSISLNQSVLSTLGAGNYTGTVTIASPTGGSQTVAVNVIVAAAPAPSVINVVNSASNVPGVVAPGEIVTIYGTNIGPTAPAGLQLTGAGMVSTTLANTTVSFDGFLAPLIYVSSGQINAIVPYEIAGRVTTNLVVMRNGAASVALPLRVADSVPAIFSATQTGNGQGAILNFNSSYNSAQNPAAKGSVIQIFATGEGALNPPVLTGSVTSGSGPTFPKPAGFVSVTIGGQPATLQYVGEAPSLVSGVLQINAVVPQNIGSGPQTVVLNVGSGTNSQQTITVAVQ